MKELKYCREDQIDFNGDSVAVASTLKQGDTKDEYYIEMTAHHGDHCLVEEVSFSYNSKLDVLRYLNSKHYTLYKRMEFLMKNEL